jgi:hypothetical protein
MHRYASIDGPYRYWLERQWGDWAPWLTVVMLNPSTADAEREDATLRVLIALAKREGFGHLQVFNLFAYRTPYPKALRQAQRDGEDIVGIGNPTLLREGALGTIGPVIVGWGANPIAREPAAQFAEWADEQETELLCVGTNLDGSPRHPLYMKSDAPLVPWPVTP